MKFKVNDQVLVTAGKDKGKQGKIVKVMPDRDAVVVEGANKYVKHIKPMGEREGQRVSVERPLPTAKIAIINDKGQPDRIGYQVSKSGVKTRVFKKTGKAVEVAANTKAKATKTKTKTKTKAKTK
jgi:large subunit ribosomal protein L24